MDKQTLRHAVQWRITSLKIAVRDDVHNGILSVDDVPNDPRMRLLTAYRNIIEQEKRLANG